jgi:hypothetical protein
MRSTYEPKTHDQNKNNGIYTKGIGVCKKSSSITHRSSHGMTYLLLEVENVGDATVTDGGDF